jgi:hypothetical protein
MGCRKFEKEGESGVCVWKDCFFHLERSIDHNMIFFCLLFPYAMLFRLMISSSRGIFGLIQFGAVETPSDLVPELAPAERRPSAAAELGGAEYVDPPRAHRLTSRSPAPIGAQRLASPSPAPRQSPTALTVHPISPFLFIFFLPPSCVFVMFLFF